MHIPSSTSLVILLATVVVLAGCNTMPRRDAAFSPSFPAALPPPGQAQTGGIYQPGYDLAFFEDVKARRIGDTLTIHLTESTNAKKSSNTATDRDQSSTIANPTILGTTPQFNLPPALPLASTDNNTLATSLSSQHEFKGSNDSEQKNSLSGDITVTVADVLPNGHLMVRGEKRLNLNEGNEYVKLSGIVRPADIATDNSVLSTKLGDATIIYTQDGVASDANKIGWIARFFVSALFPF